MKSEIKRTFENKCRCLQRHGGNSNLRCLAAIVAGDLLKKEHVES
jgi:hypothetical protein